MRKLWMGLVVVGVSLGASHTAIANYFMPGIVIVIPPKPPKDGGGGGNIGGTTNAAAMGGCVPLNAIECECFPNMLLLDACKQSGVSLECLESDTPYVDVKQPGPVLVEKGDLHVLGALTCTGKSDEVAYVNLAAVK